MNLLYQNRSLAFSQKVFEQLLLAYPAAHRAEYGADMAQLFRDQCRDAWSEARHFGLVKLWLRVLPDLLKTCLREQFSNLNPAKSMSNKISNLFSSPTAVFFKVFVAVFLLVVIASIAITFILPESYASTTRILVQPDSNDGQNILATVTNNVISYDPYFVQTTLEIIQSEVVLSKVITRLNLNVTWGKKYFAGQTLKTTETMDILKNQLLLAPVLDTKLISITVYDDDPKEAAQIANAIAESYRDYRAEMRAQLVESSLANLQTMYQLEEKQIEQSEAGLEAMRQKYDISDDASASPTEYLSQLNEPIIISQQHFEQMKAQLDNLKQLNKDQLRDALPTVFPDVTYNGLLNKLNEARQEYATLTNNPSSASTRATDIKSLVAELNQQIDDRADGIMAGLNTQVAAKHADLEALKVRTQQTKDKMPEIKPFWD